MLLAAGLARTVQRRARDRRREGASFAAAEPAAPMAADAGELPAAHRDVAPYEAADVLARSQTSVAVELAAGVYREVVVGLGGRECARARQQQAHGHRQPARA